MSDIPKFNKKTSSYQNWFDISKFKESNIGFKNFTDLPDYTVQVDEINILKDSSIIQEEELNYNYNDKDDMDFTEEPISVDYDKEEILEHNFNFMDVQLNKVKNELYDYYKILIESKTKISNTKEEYLEILSIYKKVDKIRNVEEKSKLFIISNINEFKPYVKDKYILSLNIIINKCISESDYNNYIDNISLSIFNNNYRIINLLNLSESVLNQLNILELENITSLITNWNITEFIINKRKYNK